MNDGRQLLPGDRRSWAARVERCLDGGEPSQAAAEKTARAEPAQPESASADIRLLSAEDLAREIGCSVRSVRRLDQEGRLPRPVHVGRMVRWRRAEVFAWLAADCPPRESWVWRVGTN